MSSPKNQSDSKKKDPNTLLNAIKACLLEKAGIRPVATQYGVDKSTLQRHIKKIQAEHDDISSVADSDLLQFIGIKSMKLPNNMVCSFLFMFYVFNHNGK